MLLWSVEDFFRVVDNLSSEETVRLSCRELLRLIKEGEAFKGWLIC